MRKTFIVSWMLFLTFIIFGCGGSSSSSGDASALEIGKTISFVEAKDSSTSISAAMDASIAKVLTGDTSTAYYTDPVDIYVFDDSMQALNIVNEILCTFDQTQYAAMINQGAYIALIDNSKCQKDVDRSSSEGDESSASGAIQYEEMVVISSRESADDPQIIKFWFVEPETEWEPAKQIRGKFTIAEGAGDDNPYGVFRMDFEMMSEDGSARMSQGYLESIETGDGTIEIQFAMNGSAGFDISEAVHVVMNADGSEGSAYAAFSHPGHMGDIESKAYTIGYNSSHYFFEDTTSAEEKCLSRDEFENFVFRYGLYNENGSRVSLTNQGFGIKYGDYHGYAGYYGVWLPEDRVTIEDGMVVRRASRDETTGAEYTIRVAPGVLVKHTKREITLGELRGATLFYHSFDSPTEFQVTWDGTNFNKVGQRVCGESGCNTEAIESEALVFTPGEWANFWQDGLGSIFFEIPDEALSDSTVATFDEMERLSSIDEALTLYCYSECLVANITNDQFNRTGGASPYEENRFDPGSDAYVYQIDPADMILRDSNGDPIQVASDVAVEAGGPNNWGINSGPMLTTTLANPWEAWGETVTYQWETGPNHWNKMTTLIDELNNTVIFNPPLMVNYVRVTDSGNARFLLDYQGFGELHGIPWEPEDPDNPFESRWYPEFTISSGSEVSDNDGNLYYVKAVEMEQRMTEVGVGECSEIVPESLAAPDADFVDPEIGDMPTVTDDPAVIGGELVE